MKILWVEKASYIIFTVILFAIIAYVEPWGENAF